jgi:hypothetical protein
MRLFLAQGVDNAKVIEDGSSELYSSDSDDSDMEAIEIEGEIIGFARRDPRSEPLSKPSISSFPSFILHKITSYVVHSVTAVKCACRDATLSFALQQCMMRGFCAIQDP